MKIKQEIELDFKDVLIEPKRSSLSSRSEVSLIKHYNFANSPYSWSGVPIIAANMDTVGSIKMARIFHEKGLMVALHKHYTTEELSRFFLEEASQNTFYSIGIVESDLKKLEEVIKKVGVWNGEVGIKQVCIDVANGYTETFVDFIRKFRDQYKGLTIMAGNVVTGEMTEELILSGVDIVKVGIGPGSVCTTRKMTGVGYPQLSAVIECADAAHGIGGHICSDGGCTVPGDLAKAFGGGSDFIMLGGMLAGHHECDGEVVEQNGKQYLKFYGMSSKEAMNKHHGGVANYRASEGKCVLIELKGSVENTLQDILGGVRSACTYVGAKNLKELPKRTTFIKVTQQINEVFGKS